MDYDFDIVIIGAATSGSFISLTSWHKRDIK